MVPARRAAISHDLDTGYEYPARHDRALTHHAIVGSGKTYDRYDMRAEKRQAVDAIAQYIFRTLRHGDAVARGAA